MVEPIEPPASHYLLAAQGWLELGNYPEAEAELRHLPESLRAHPQVLTVRYELYAKTARWELAAEVAGILVETFAHQAGAWISLAYATRRKPGGGIPPARDILTRALALFPTEAIILYNLACYDCQLGHQTAALTWLLQARAQGGKTEIRSLALADPDLKPLWPVIASW
jgi:Flp pilus assembly protein TadD